MLRRLTIPIVLLLLLPSPSLASSNATCPYDIPTASRLIPHECYANASIPSATSCCWYVFAAYLYAAILHSNLTGIAFLPSSTASSCSSSFSSFLIRQNLVRPSLLLYNDSCNLSGNPVALAAGNRPCQFSTVSDIRSSVNFTNPIRVCASPLLNLDNNSNCVPCQQAVVKATFALFNVTRSKEFVPCGMASTLAIWSPSPPSIPRFLSYALCLLQILENVGNLGTGGLIPSPPSAPAAVSAAGPTASRSSHSRSAKIAAIGSAAAGLVSLSIIAFLILSIRKRRRLAAIKAGDLDLHGDRDRDSPARIGPPLPTEGLYIFTKSELKQATSGYSDRLVLGEGGAGKVYLGKLPSGQNVAIKRIYRKKKLGEFYREVEILAKLRHRNLTTLVGYCVGVADHVLVYEYMAGGNLARALYHGELTWQKRVRIAADVAEGLVYLHEFPDGAVVHRDVKPNNVLLTDGGQAKLSDFGVSRIVPSDGSHVSTEIRGTMGYVDPESFSAGHVSESADVYSFGVVLLELVTGMKAVVPTPSGGAESVVNVARAVVSDGEEVDSIVDPKLGPEWDRGSVGAVFELACRCVRPYKKERPRMGEILRVLKGVLVDLESLSAAEVAAVSEDSNVPSTSGPSTPSVHAWSL